MSSASMSPHPRVSVNSICSMKQSFGDDLALWTELGIDHVGLGLDYFSTDESGYRQFVTSGVWKPEFYPPPPYHYPAGIDDASMLPNMASALLRRGYSAEDTVKVLGGNFIRVFKEVWRE